MRGRLSTLPADVLGRLFVRTVDEEDRVVAWYVAPCDGRVKLDPDGPQAGIYGRGQEQNLKRVGLNVGCSR